jgi:hypothetical protein
MESKTKYFIDYKDKKWDLFIIALLTGISHIIDSTKTVKVVFVVCLFGYWLLRMYKDEQNKLYLKIEEKEISKKEYDKENKKNESR